MWIPSRVLDWFESLKEASDSAISVNIALVNDLRQELTAVKTERDALKLQAAVNQNNFEWIRTRVNALEMERAQLIQKAYGINLPVPEVVRTPRPGQGPEDTGNQFSFDDLGEDMARKLGFPTYDKQ